MRISVEHVKDAGTAATIVVGDIIGVIIHIISDYVKPFDKFCNKEQTVKDVVFIRTLSIIFNNSSSSQIAYYGNKVSEQSHSFSIYKASYGNCSVRDHSTKIVTWFHGL